MPSLGPSALWYANRGHLVFPLRPGQKTPATRNGFKDATMAPDTIRAWWGANPNYNIGLVTGHLFDVIDIDGPWGIIEATNLEDTGHLPPHLGIVATPRGYHILINPTGDGCATAIRKGIDYRGIGGYVVAPPSIVEGNTYRWIEPLTKQA